MTICHVHIRPASRTGRCDSMFFFFFNDTATTEIYTLSLHDALPIYNWPVAQPSMRVILLRWGCPVQAGFAWARISSRLERDLEFVSRRVFARRRKSTHPPKQKKLGRGTRPVSNSPVAGTPSCQSSGNAQSRDRRHQQMSFVGYVRASQRALITDSDLRCVNTDF